jgi:hypothetical protein
VAHATAVIGTRLLVAQQGFRRLNAPELMREVYHDATFAKGGRVLEQA